MTHSRSAARQEQILETLVRQQQARVSELAELLGVSGWTVRRDLNQMEEQGLVERSYGRVHLLPSAQRLSAVVDTEIHRADDPQLKAKQQIGRAAARLLRGSQHVALGAGTTTTQVAHALQKAPCCTKVMTNALNIAMILSRSSEIEVTCTGGTVHGSYHTLTGPVAEQALRHHYFDCAVVGVSGITAREGLTVNSQLNAFTMQILIEQAQRTMIVADHTKMGRVRFAHLAPLCAARWLITDRDPPEEIRRRLEECEVELIVASELVS